MGIDWFYFNIISIQYHACHTGKASLVRIEPLELCRGWKPKKREKYFEENSLFKFINPTSTAKLAYKFTLKYMKFVHILE